MEEMMNQENQEVELLDVSDLEEAGEAPETEEAEEQEVAPTADQPTEEPPETIRAKYKDHTWNLPKKEMDAAAQAMGLTAEDMVTLLQKGMNYDNREARPTPEAEVLDFYARANGMTRAQYVQMLQQNQREMLANQERERLAAQYPNADPRLLQEMARLSAVQKESEAQRQRQQQEAARYQMAQQQEQARRAPWERFFRAHPDLEAKSLPREMMERVAEGEDPTAVWASMELAAKEKELETLKQQIDARKRAPGPVASDGKEGETDPFLAGLLG